MSKLVNLTVMATLAFVGSAATADSEARHSEIELAIERHFPTEPNAGHHELELAIERHFPTEPRPNFQPEQRSSPRLDAPLRMPASVASKVSVAMREDDREKRPMAGVIDSRTIRASRTR